jgi:hypothetical protein
MTRNKNATGLLPIAVPTALEALGFLFFSKAAISR